jgi:hypothetical protein
MTPYPNHNPVRTLAAGGTTGNAADHLACMRPGEDGTTPAAAGRNERRA